MTDTTRVLTEQIPGPRGYTGATGATGAQGGPGVDAIVKTVTSASVRTRVAEPDPGVPGSIRAATAMARRRFAGIFTATQIAGLTQPIQHAGPVHPADYSLGVGERTAVGCDINGALVRVTDPACVSGLNFIGWCDEAGTIQVQSTCAPTFHVKDCGARGGLHSSDTAGILSAIKRAREVVYSIPGVGSVQGGGIVEFDGDEFLLTKSLILSKLVSGVKPYSVSLRGTGLAFTRLAFDVPPSAVFDESTDEAWGDAIIFRQEDGNTVWGMTIERLLIQNMRQGNAATRAQNTGSGIEIVGSGGLEIRDCRIIGFKTNVMLNSTNLVHVDGCHFGAVLSNGYPSAADGYYDDCSIKLALATEEGHGLEAIGAGATNGITIERCQFNGNFDGVRIRDGIGHSIRSCNFNNPAFAVRASGSVNLEIDGCISEAPRKETYFEIDGANQNVAIRRCIISGHRDSIGRIDTPAVGTSMVRWSGGGSCDGFVLEENYWSGGTGDNRALLNVEAPGSITGNCRFERPTGLTAPLFTQEVAIDSVITLETNKHGIGTVIPGANLDVRRSSASVDQLWVRGPDGARPAVRVSPDCKTQEAGMGQVYITDTFTQQGRVTLYESGAFTSGGADVDQIYNPDDTRFVAEVEMIVCFNFASANEGAVVRKNFFVYRNNGDFVVYDSANQPADDTKPGSTFTFSKPTCVAVDPLGGAATKRALRFRVIMPVCVGDVGSWLSEIRILQRTIL